MHNMLATARHACGRHWGVSDGGMVSVMNNKLMHSTGEHTDSHTYAYNAIVRKHRRRKEIRSYDSINFEDTCSFRFLDMGDITLYSGN